MLNSAKAPKLLEQYKNSYFTPRSDKMKILVNSYEDSLPFNIRSGSQTGSIKLAHIEKVDDQYT